MLVASRPFAGACSPRPRPSVRVGGYVEGTRVSPTCADCLCRLFVSLTRRFYC